MKMEKSKDIMVHPTAVVEDGAKVGSGTKIWHHCHIRASANIGGNCNLGKNVYVDINVKIGRNVKIQNNVSVYDGVILEDDVFVGPSAVFTNDLYPRAFVWEESSERASILVRKGASIGANATIICGERIIGEYALVGAGAVVTKNVPAHGLVLGNPAKLKGFVCKCARKLRERERKEKEVVMYCKKCNEDASISLEDYKKLS